MLAKLPSHLRRWGIIAAATAGVIWLVLNPELVLEPVDDNIPPSSRQSANRGDQYLSKNNSQKSGFDFYVLALSWSPSFCASSKRTSGLQCGGKRFYSFIVHGLWPQYEKRWPSYCKIPATRVNTALVNAMLDIMPDQGLVQQQWRKHGTCTGLDQQKYFAKLRSAYENIRFPARYRLNDKYLMVSPQELESAFLIENPGLAANAIAVTCDKRRLREVRVCFSKELKFRACPQVDRNSCRKESVVMPPVRDS